MGAIPRMAQGLATGVALVVGVAGLAGGLAAHGGRISARLDLLTHFAPFWLAASLLGLTLALALPQGRARALALGASTVGVFAAAALMAPEYLRPVGPTATAAAAPSGRRIKLIQFNAWDRNRDPEGSAAWIAAQNPDFVVIEEAEAPMLAAMTRRGFTYSRGMVRSALFSRTPPLAPPYQIVERDWHRLPPFSRGTFALDGQAFSIIGVHLTWPTWWFQRVQMAALSEMAARNDRDHLILVGDFNLTPWSFALQGLDRRLGLIRRDRALFSWPAQPFWRGRLSSPVPLLPIDHVYAGAAWRTVSITRGPRLGSDHYPVVVVLALEGR